jgi:hypothetical protein
MEDVVINFVPSNTVSPKDILIDLMPTPPFTEAVTALYYWRFEDEPDSEYQYLGQQSTGFAFNVPFEGSGREIRISMIGKAANGVQSTYDPREGVQTTITPPNPLDTVLSLDGDTLTLDGDVLTLS